jgi:hypothetical protein
LPEYSAAKNKLEKSLIVSSSKFDFSHWSC